MFFQRKAISCPLTYAEIPLATKLENLRFVVFDTETTGFHVSSIDRLIEIGAVPVEGFQVQDKEYFQTYVNPMRQISREISELTSITDEKVENAPESYEAIQQFFDFVEAWETVCLVGHYVSFDALVIKSELKRAKATVKNIYTIDTLDLIGVISPSYDMRDLERYAKIFGTRIYERHSALGDALTTAYLFVELLWHFKQRGYQTWGELMERSNSV
ncbi:3'-5' exonuclease [Robertmurraya yapensis]|uniref:3'-5' exonuclease n=1 Tax=Bacillus yapensis TaxID=2492960 RepID=A0A3S0RNY2_9BACI|nr:3'-5' exonuclease [Bacillus yapensis]RTR32966.1 3'-5' exonuclease [Bacillus yapensis]TKS96789.1 3'-5' exonuclease [Bacillus yapensis]